MIQDPEYARKYWERHDPKDILCHEEYELMELVRKKFGRYAKGKQFYKGITETGFEFYVSKNYGKEVWNEQLFEQAKEIIETSNDYLEYCKRAMAFRHIITAGHKWIGPTI